MDDSIRERGKALEDRFFKQKDDQLLEKLRQDMAAKEGRDALAHASGIDDVGVLDALIEQQVTAESLASLSLVPLVAVAWADGKMESAESSAILQAAGKAGVKDGSPGYSLLESWLAQQPGNELLDCWSDYIGALKANLEPAVLQQLKSSILTRAKEVAEAAGGILGFGNKISAPEQKVIEQLEAAFE